MRIVAIAAAIPLVVIFTAGCAPVEVKPVARHVHTTVQERADLPVVWTGVTQEEAQVQAAVNDLLTANLTAASAVQIALLNNPQLQATYAQLGVSQAQLVQAGLLRNPVFDLTLRMANGEIPRWEMTVVQDFLDVLLVPLRKKVAAAELERAQLEVAGAVIDLAADTRRAFIRYQADKQMIGLWHCVVLATEASYEMARQIRIAGTTTDLYLSNEEALYRQAKLNLASAELQQVDSREQLNRLMGLWGPAAQWDTQDHLPEVTESQIDVSRVEAEAIDRSIDLRTAYMAIVIAAGRYGIQGIERFAPEMTIGPYLERERGNEYSLVKKKNGQQTDYALRKKLASATWWAGPTLTLPIPIWDQGQAMITAGQWEIRRLWNLYTHLAIGIRSATRRTSDQYLMLRRMALYNRDVLLPLRHHITERTQLRYNGMLVGVFDLLEARQMEIDAGRAYLTSLRDYWLIHTDLEQILMGRATATGVANNTSPPSGLSRGNGSNNPSGQSASAGH